MSVILNTATDIDNLWLLEYAERWQNWQGSSAGMMISHATTPFVSREFGSLFYMIHFITTYPVVTT
jgi:hypothetical protein